VNIDHDEFPPIGERRFPAGCRLPKRMDDNNSNMLRKLKVGLQNLISIAETTLGRVDDIIKDEKEKIQLDMLMGDDIWMEGSPTKPGNYVILIKTYYFDARWNERINEFDCKCVRFDGKNYYRLYFNTLMNKDEFDKTVEETNGMYSRVIICHREGG
jgi:hypothetical protein